MGDPATTKLILTGVSFAASMLLAPKIEGPRLDTLDVSTADPGTPMADCYGYVRVDGCSIIHAEKLREKKVDSKTKGGKYTGYKYFGTATYLVCGHPVDAVAKVRWDRKIVYDATKKGPITVLLGLFGGLGGQSPVKLAENRNFRIALGGESQLPNPRYVAWCEDRYGPDSAPAYRGITTLDFIDVPLEKVGNRLPQVSADVVRVKTPAYLEDELDGTGGASFSPDYLRFSMGDGIYDTATHEKIIDLNFGIAAWGSNGTLWELYDFINPLEGVKLRAWGFDGQFSREPVIGPTGDFADSVFLIPSTGQDFGEDTIFLRPYDAQQNKLMQLTGTEIVTTAIDFSPTVFLRDGDGELYGLGRNFGGSNGIRVSNITFLREGASSETIPTSSTAQVGGFLNAEGNWVLLQGDTAYLVDPSTYGIIDSVTGPFDTTDVSPNPGGYTFWTVSGTTATEWSMLDLSTIRAIDLTAWGGTGLGGLYDPINHAILQYRAGANRLLYLDRIDDDSVINLSDILTEECTLAGAIDQDFSGADPTIQGWQVAPGPVADRIGPLLEMHDIDACPHDFGILFKVRGAAAALSIDSSEFVREGETRWSAPITQDVMLPRQMTFTYADKSKDGQPNTSTVQRSGDIVDTRRIKNIDMSTFYSDPDEAQPLAERRFRREWFEREELNFSLTMREAALEPGDIRQIVLDDEPRVARLTEITRSGNLLKSKWKRDDPRVHDKNASAGPTLDGRDDEELYISGPTKAFVLDIPYLRDSELTTNVLLHEGAGAYSNNSSWPGATIYQLDPVENEYGAIESIESANRAVWGYSVDALAEASPSVWDGRSTVTIRLRGELVSRSQDDIDADPTINLAYLGDEAGNGELFNFADAVLNIDGTWTLSNLKRGRRGTEWAIEGHGEGDLFVLASSFVTDEIGIDEIGETLIYKGQSEGRTLDGAPEIEVPIEARSLKPYAPTSLTATLDGSDWQLDWIRRTRIGGNWSSGTSIPLGETTEAYRIRFFDEDGEEVAHYDTTDPEFLYEVADQTTDFGGAQTALRWSVCQLGDAVEGFEAYQEVGLPPYVSGLGNYNSSSSGSRDLSLPTDIEPDDVLLLLAEAFGPNPVPVPAGWEEVPDSPQIGTTSRLHVFWKRAGFSSVEPSISSGGHISGRIIGIRGAVALGSPFHETAGSTTTGTGLSSPGLTTDVNNCLIVDCFALGAISGANASLTDFAQQFTHSDTLGGQGAGVACYTGIKGTAGSVSATTATQPLGGSENVGVIKLAIRS